MAGIVPFNPQRQVSQAGTFAPSLPQSYGMAPIAARAQQTQAVLQIADRSIDLLAAYAEKHKENDKAADEAAFKAFVSQKTTEAELAAKQTGDLKEVKRIYSGVEQSIRDYVKGSNPESGTPNFRWQDHQDSMVNHLESLKVELGNRAAARAVEVSMADTRAKMDAQIKAGIETGDYKAIGTALDLLHANGQITREEAAAKKKENYRAADEYQIKKQLMAIESMSPDQAEMTLETVGQTIADSKHLDDASKKELSKLGTVAVNNAKAAEARARRERLGASEDALMNYQLANNGNLPTLTELETLGLAPEHRLEIMKAWNKANKTAAEDGTLFSELYQEVKSFSIDAEGKPRSRTEVDRMSLQLRISQLPSDQKSVMMDLFKKQITPGKETMALGAERIIGVVGVRDVKGKFKGGEEPFEMLDDGQRNYVLKTSLDRFNKWAEEGVRTDDEIIHWVDKDPYLSGIRAQKEKKKVHAAYMGSEPPPALRSTQLDLLTPEQKTALGL